VRITLTDDAPIYRKPYKYSDAEQKMIQTRTAELVEAGLVELARQQTPLTLTRRQRLNIVPLGISDGSLKPFQPKLLCTKIPKSEHKPTMRKKPGNDRYKPREKSQIPKGRQATPRYLSLGLYPVNQLWQSLQLPLFLLHWCRQS
jgi:hypothetical protein